MMSFAHGRSAAVRKPPRPRPTEACQFCFTLFPVQGPCRTGIALACLGYRSWVEVGRFSPSCPLATIESLAAGGFVRLCKFMG